MLRCLVRGDVFDSGNVLVVLYGVRYLTQGMYYVVLYGVMYLTQGMCYVVL